MESRRGRHGSNAGRQHKRYNELISQFDCIEVDAINDGNWQEEEKLKGSCGSRKAAMIVGKYGQGRNYHHRFLCDVGYGREGRE